MHITPASRVAGQRSGTADRAGLHAGSPPPSGSDGFSPLDIARLIYMQRRRRDELFGTTLFADPAWDLLLDLYAAPAGSGVCVTSACAAAAVPATTALRWLQTLEAAGMVERAPDPTDGRRHLLSLSPATRERMTRYLQDLAGRWPS